MVHRYLFLLVLLAGSKDPAYMAGLLTGPAYVDARVQQPPRDAAATATETVVVRGRVVTAANGQPLHRVRLTLTGGSQNPPSGVTDARGEFEIADVPAGTYTLTAARAGYLTLQYGQRRRGEAGRPIVVRAGETVEKLEMALQRGGVLAGRIFDDTGDAASGVRVEAVEFRYIRGRRVAVAARITATNDVGEFRLSNLEPGAYQLRASSRDAWESDDGKTTFVYATTFFPGVTAVDQAQNLTVAAGQEIGGLDIRLVPGREARVTGVVQDASGAPVPGLMVNFGDITRTVGGALQSQGGVGSARTNERGEFAFENLSPGEYMAYGGGPNNTTNATVVLNAGDTKHIVLTPARTPAVAGTLATDDGSRLPFAAARLTVTPVDADPDNVFAPWAGPNAQSPRPDWGFRIVNMVGEYLFRVTGLPDDWRLGAVMFGGRDIIDTPLPVARGAADVEGLQLVLTRKVARLEGQVLDRNGAVTSDATVIVFAEGRAAWGIGSRFVKVTRPERDGRFVIAGLPPGTYRVIARDFVAVGQWEDPEFLQSLFRDATRVDLKEGVTETLTLTVMEAR